ncbi:MAG: DUF4412 domain-containing protein [Betaproteobacteria bacterium]|nr:DUF4412 domain-containing protein [Betaproteobacteria bacterium]
MRIRLLPLAAALAVAGAHAATPVSDTAQRAQRHEFRWEAKDLPSDARELAREMRERAHEFVAQLSHDLRIEGDAAALAFVAGEMGSSREIVKNAPYTAEAVTESVQVLADGNRIVRETRTLLARDTQGRTRQEKKGPGGTKVYVFDPVADRSFVLDTERKTSLRLPRVPVPPVPPVPPGAAAPPAPPAPPAAHGSGAHVEVGPGHVIVRRGGDNDKEVRVEVVRIARGDGAPLAPPPMLAVPPMPRGKGETKELGKRDFGGVSADGTLTTHTIPAGQIGNEKPIVVTSERWFSPDLHVVVYLKSVDPRSGETIYRLVNVKREEPPADLFRVPADYKGR